MSGYLPLTAAIGETEQGRILVVEDNPLIRAALRAILEGEGYHIEAAGSASVALELAHRRPFDLVALDLGLPDRDGRQVLRQLKHAPRTRHVPVLVLSSITERLGETERNLACAVVSKPFEVDELLGSVARALCLSASRHQPGSIALSLN